MTLETADGVVTSAPLVGGNSKGYGFVQTDDDRSVFLPTSLVKREGLTTDDMGRRVRVRFATTGKGYMAVSAHFGLEIDDLADVSEEIASKTKELLAYMTQIDANTAAMRIALAELTDLHREKVAGRVL